MKKCRPFTTLYTRILPGTASGGIASSNGVKDTWEKEKAAAAILTCCLINLLQEGGLEVYPLLVSERGHGKVNPDYPFIDQFNKVMAYVLIDGSKIHTGCSRALYPVIHGAVLGYQYKSIYCKP